MKMHRTWYTYIVSQKNKDNYSYEELLLQISAHEKWHMVLPLVLFCLYMCIHNTYWSGGKHKAHFLRAVHIEKSLRFFYQFQRWVGMKQAELTNFFCQQRWSARFDLHVWSNVLKNFGDSETFFLSKAIATTIALSKSTRFYLEDIIDSTWTNQG